MPFVFVLFPLYGVKKERKVITCEEKKRIILRLVLQKFRSCLC